MPDLEAFTANREHLIGLAYRMLGGRADAEDAVQEAWLRFAAMPEGEILDPRAWLTTVTGRICLDVLRSARVKREAYVGSWLPEPIVQLLPATNPDPAELAAKAEQVSMALLVVLETLPPEQRVAFVLHDVFAVPFDEIAPVLDTSPTNARQLASRARKAVAAGQRRHVTDRAQQRRVVDAFMAAAAGGDLDALLKLLAPEVSVIGDGGGVAPATRTPVVGALKVARFVQTLFRQTAEAGAVLEPVLVNGDLGMLLEVEDYHGQPVHGVVTFSISQDGQVTGLYNMLNPAKLTRVPRADPQRAQATWASQDW
jgi:RNA polymerase sigma-70 factor (ECF subfamily)